MNTNTKGRVAELIAITKYISLGYVVLEPFNKDGVYDFVIELNGNFKKVQVKTLRDLGDVYELNIRSVGHNRKRNIHKHYEKSELDIFVGVDVLLNKVFEIPFDFKNKSLMSLRKNEVMSRQRKKIRFAKDFELCVNSSQLVER